MDIEEIQSNRAVDLLAKIKQLQTENEAFNHAIEHVLDCDKTKLCRECKKLLNLVYDPNWWIKAKGE